MRRAKLLLLPLMCAVVLGGLAIPGSAAPEKIYSLVAPLSVTASTTTIDIAIKNEVPNGNSTINSLRITASGPSGFLITGATPGTASVSPDGKSVSLTNIAGIRPLRTRVFTLTVVVPAVPCGNAIVWGGSAFTGNSLGGDAFRLLGEPPSQLTTEIGDCSSITVTKYEDENVNGARDDGESALAGWEFTLLENGSPVTSPQETGANGTTTFPVVSGHTYSVCETDDRIDESLAGWDEEPWFNTEPGGDACAEVTTSTGSDHDLDFGNQIGTLGCDPDNNTIVSEDGEVTVERLANTDGEVPCILKPASLTHEIGQDEETVTFLVTGTQSAAYRFTITWEPVPNTNPPVIDPTTIDLPGGEHVLQWCVPDGGDLNLEPDVPAGEVGCIVSQVWTIADAGHVEQTETIYVEADIVFSKR